MQKKGFDPLSIVKNTDNIQKVPDLHRYLGLWLITGTFAQNQIKYEQKHSIDQMYPAFKTVVGSLINHFDHDLNLQDASKVALAVQMIKVNDDKFL